MKWADPSPFWAQVWRSARLRSTLIKGGSWNNQQGNARVSNRNNNNPNNRNNNIGFRVVFSHKFTIGLRSGLYCQQCAWVTAQRRGKFG
ncbi:MAG: SUMF1/EgtB/PvdO family nonheme iron enzyme [Anaerolineales bacterium]